MVGVDFTASNGAPSKPTSLHHIGKDNLNEYQKCCPLCTLCASSLLSRLSSQSSQVRGGRHWTLRPARFVCFRSFLRAVCCSSKLRWGAYANPWLAARRRRAGAAAVLGAGHTDTLLEQYNMTNPLEKTGVTVQLELVVARCTVALPKRLC